MHAQSPTVDFTQVDLLQVLVVAIGRKQRVAALKILIQVAPLRERRAVPQPLAVLARDGNQCAVIVPMLSLDAPAQFIVAGERLPPEIGQGAERLAFASQQVLKKTRRAAHGLTGIVQNVIQPRQPLEQELRKELDARGVPQIQTMNLQALPE